MTPASTDVLLRYRVVGQADPAFLPRVLEPFCVLSAVPVAVTAHRRDDRMTVTLTMAPADIPDPQAMARRLAGIVLVETATLMFDAAGEADGELRRSA
jgi:hypothetical protein